jgi:branched-chain amino acid transport system ATP-binding protein
MPSRRQSSEMFSSPLQQMLAIARALVGNPAVMLMDEPSEGLAPVIVEELVRAIRHLAGQGLTLVLVEQNTQLALDMSPRTVVMDRGRIIYDGASNTLKANRDKLEGLIGVGR